MKKITYLLLLITLPTIAQVSIPDLNFETELIAQGIDTDGLVNGQISNADALAKTGTLNVDDKNISDLTGIEAFTNITRLDCNFNNLNALDFSAITGLLQVRCRNNNITSINTTSNTNLQELRIHNNELTVLDVSSNSNFIRLLCQGNNLTELNVKTGNNINMTAFFAQNNPSLTCIEVDDAAFADANFTKDAAASFSKNCNTLSTSNFNKTQNIDLFPNPTSNSITVTSTTKIVSLELYNLLGKRVMLIKNKSKLDLSNFNSGLYLLKIQTEQGIITKKVIKN